MSDARITALMEAALEIAQERREDLAKLRAALESGNDTQALELARELCGVDYEKGNRVNPSVH
jgi:hypothetical protein